MTLDELHTIRQDILNIKASIAEQLPLRDQFAMAALSLMAKMSPAPDADQRLPPLNQADRNVFEWSARVAYGVADAMLRVD